MQGTELLVVGAGPFGLALASAADRKGIDHVVVGRPMAFWKEHMPAGMLLRSASDWHLDVLPTQARRRATRPDRAMRTGQPRPRPPGQPSRRSFRPPSVLATSPWITRLRRNPGIGRLWWMVSS